MWKDTEPVRTWLYGLLAPVIALLVGYGILTDQHAELWIAVVTAALGITGTESARKQVTPLARATRETDSE